MPHRPVRPSFLGSFLLATVAAAVPCRAQNPADLPPPKPPFVAPVPDRADWTITVRPGGTPPLARGGKPALAQIVEVHSTKTGNIQRNEVSYSNGTKVTDFYVSTLHLWKDQAGTVAMNDMREADISIGPEDPSPTAVEGFPGTRWLRLSWYDKVIVIQTRPCYHFVHGESEAWIDAATKLPVAYKAGATGYTFKFNDPPGEILTLPAELQKVLQIYQDNARRKRELEQPLPPNE